MSNPTANELLGHALRLKEDVETRGDELQRLGLDVVQLLAESEVASKHQWTRTGYSTAMSSHDRFISQMLELSETAAGLDGQFRRAHYEAQIGEILERSVQADVNAPAEKELASLRKHAEDTVMSTPDTVAAVLASVYISEFTLALAHANTLAAFLNRPPLSIKVMEGAGKLLKAALLDMGGSVFPFLGTAETVFELATTQLSRDQERMRSAVEESDRLWFFIDQISALVRGADLALGSAHTAEGAITEANTNFDTSSRWLIDTLPSA